MLLVLVPFQPSAALTVLMVEGPGSNRKQVHHSECRIWTDVTNAPDSMEVLRTSRYITREVEAGALASFIADHSTSLSCMNKRKPRVRYMTKV